jgi:UDP-glucose/galactose:(glucosyl)LPS alpha-1,2-glucosyl/galactosyltransferase
MIYNVAYSTNSNLFHFLVISIYSLLKNNQGNTFIIHILHTELSNKNILYLNKVTKKFKSKLNFYLVNSILINHINLSKQYPKEAYYRLLIPDLIHVDKLLYLDVDTIILGKIDTLFNLNLSTSPIAATKDFETITNLDRILPNKSLYYFNSGVMMLNLDLWRSENISYKVINFINNNSDFIRYADQCGLNAIIYSNWLILDQKFNYQIGFYKTTNNKNSDENIILHYTSPKDSFNFYKFPSDFKNILYKYYRNIDFYKFIKFYILNFINQYFTSKLISLFYILNKKCKLTSN